MQKFWVEEFQAWLPEGCLKVQGSQKSAKMSQFVKITRISLLINPSYQKKFRDQKVIYKPRMWIKKKKIEIKAKTFWLEKIYFTKNLQNIMTLKKICLLTLLGAKINEGERPLRVKSPYFFSNAPFLLKRGNFSHIML